ncbi:MAG TPA: hypothetical protein DCR24_15410 [Bacillus bacterium]|nr:hypothetical protein [Bacillus sp. (in: firmicutes)]
MRLNREIAGSAFFCIDKHGNVSCTASHLDKLGISADHFRMKDPFSIKTPYFWSMLKRELPEKEGIRVFKFQ